MLNIHCFPVGVLPLFRNHLHCEAKNFFIQLIMKNVLKKTILNSMIALKCQTKMTHLKLLFSLYINRKLDVWSMASKILAKRINLALVQRFFRTYGL